MENAYTFSPLPAFTVMVAAPVEPAMPAKTSASWSLPTVWWETWVKVSPRLSVIVTEAPKSTKAPTMMRSPEVTLPENALLAVWPLVWAVETLWMKVMGRVALLTVTATAAEVAWLPDVSVAVAVMVCAPLATAVEFQLTL